MQDQEESSFEKGLRIHVDLRYLKSIQVPALQLTSLKFKPKAFAVENPKLEGKIIEKSAQVHGYRQFLANPTMPVTYISAGNPDDVKARYFAAHLVEAHVRHLQALGRSPRVVWEQLYGGFDNPAMTTAADATMLVIDNLSAIPNRVKYDKVRDLIARYPSIPKVLVVSGEDPVSFAAARIFKPAHGIAYFPTKLPKVAQTII